ncbi:MAG: hypothetical protein BGO07_01895 [Alphaproteobacteria bacterium 40-19]|nr:MAG: hypothetical protein BGO07_01895 [Alphaproteobacteria bacterium 40-19]
MNFISKDAFGAIATELLQYFCGKNDIVFSPQRVSFLSDIKMDRDSAVSLAHRLDEFLRSCQVTKDLTADGLLKKFVEKNADNVGEGFLQGIQWLDCPKESDPDFQTKMGGFLKQFEDSKGNIALDIVMQCCDRIQNKTKLNQVFSARPEEKVLEIIFRTNLIVEKLEILGDVFEKSLNNKNVAGDEI